jgi:UDP-3-O-[3-hydroxymyristoyl] N-acetylglucosamine deacetylase
MKKELILIVDDEPGILVSLSNILKDEGYRTLTTGRGEEALTLYQRHLPDVVFLDIWLPDLDGLETLKTLLELDPGAAVIMMSGHGTTPTAVRAIKMGACDYLEKPLSYDQVVDAVEGALREKPNRASKRPDPVLELAKARMDDEVRVTSPPRLPLLQESATPQRTICSSKVIYGLGLHSGSRTGTVIPAHISAAGNTEYATTLTGHGEGIRTVEHLLSALHASGITNLLIKVHGEIPVLDGSALEFCNELEKIGIEDQGVPRQELVIDRKYVVGDEEKGKFLAIEPFDGLSVSYQLSYPPPVGDQFCEFILESPSAYKEQVAPARTFGFMRDLKMMNELGLGSGGRLDNFILVGEDNVINTELRFPDEFVRHKILDIIGDFYLLGFPVRGKVTARFSGHRDNIALQQQILDAVS